MLNRESQNGEETKLVFKISGPDIEVDEIIVGRQGLRAGRGGDNTLIVKHREISRQHMRIYWRDDDKYLVEDLNSSNGVWVNDTRLVSRVPAELQVGDVVRFGPYILTLDRLIFTQSAPIRQVYDDFSGLLVDESPSSTSENAIVDSDAPHRAVSYPPGVPRDRSTWLQYLPAIYSNDDFFGRYLLIAESMFSPIVWMIDNFDLYLAPDVTPQAWLQWMAGWFDILLVPELKEERQREIMRQAGWLFLRRGTPSGLRRMIELYFGVQAEIIEEENCHFIVRLPLSRSDLEMSPAIAQALAGRLIASQKPAFASFSLEIT